MKLSIESGKTSDSLIIAVAAAILALAALRAIVNGTAPLLARASVVGSNTQIKMVIDLAS
ncbi:hypothetical protein [Moellerella wisconsensis]|uniref:Uncharacterized protein n=1 Tax=Moellerella wisconsensis TaxID=158849 RepID=A0ACD3Y4L6_9GAMM|nr:hypothetical protein [Moellerella wisconsensis]UNH37819.1 hypothetical protein MNY70_09840 [Moellerella wisconsensis]